MQITKSSFKENGLPEGLSKKIAYMVVNDIKYINTDFAGAATTINIKAQDLVKVGGVENGK